MIKYETPLFETLELEEENIVTTSGNTLENMGNGGSVGDITDWGELTGN